MDTLTFDAAIRALIAAQPEFTVADYLHSIRAMIQAGRERVYQDGSPQTLGAFYYDLFRHFLIEIEQAQLLADPHLQEGIEHLITTETHTPFSLPRGVIPAEIAPSLHATLSQIHAQIKTLLAVKAGTTDEVSEDRRWFRPDHSEPEDPHISASQEEARRIRDAAAQRRQQREEAP